MAVMLAVAVTVELVVVAAILVGVAVAARTTLLFVPLKVVSEHTGTGPIRVLWIPAPRIAV